MRVLRVRAKDIGVDHTQGYKIIDAIVVAFLSIGHMVLGVQRRPHLQEET